MKLFLASMKGICIAAVLTFSSVSSAIDDSTHIVVEVPVLHTEVAYGNVVEREPRATCIKVVMNKELPPINQFGRCQSKPLPITITIGGIEGITLCF